MTLYEVFDKIAENLSDGQKQKHQIASYLKESMDDNIEFTRSRYCKRAEGILPDRDLGTIEYIVCGCSKPFHPDQIQYISYGEIEQATDFQAQIIWGKQIESLEEDKEFCESIGFSYITVINNLK